MCLQRPQIRFPLVVVVHRLDCINNRAQIDLHLMRQRVMIISVFTRRLAEVWMDDYKNYYYERIGYLLVRRFSSREFFIYLYKSVVTNRIFGSRPESLFAL